MRNFAYKWFARFVIIAPPTGLAVLFVYGNYRTWWVDSSSVPNWAVNLIGGLDLVMGAMLFFALVGGIVVLGPRIWSWLWDHAELRRRRDPRL